MERQESQETLLLAQQSVMKFKIKRKPPISSFPECPDSFPCRGFRHRIPLRCRIRRQGSPRLFRPSHESQRLRQIVEVQHGNNVGRRQIGRLPVPGG